MSRSRGPGGSGQLSMLARGHGLLGGGVQVDCFADDRRAFTLTGQPFIKPSSYAPSTVKPYRTHQLALPTTYVTRRGQMVLFTAPEDMIIGSSCHIHKREVTSQAAANQLKTTSNLMESALSYSTENDKSSSISNSGSTMHTGNESADTMATGVKAGHFTNVYLHSLQKASQQKSTNQSVDDCAVEDIETKSDSPKGDSGTTDNPLRGDSELPLVSECDSGLGHSITPSPSGRISIQSHTSDASSVSSFVTMTGHVIRVPDGREMNTATSSEPRGGAATATPTLGTGTQASTSVAVAEDSDDPLTSLRRELGLQQNPLQVTKSDSKKKSSSKPGKKRHHSKSDPCSDSKTSEHKTKRKNGTHDGLAATSSKTLKSKRKRTRNKLDINKQGSSLQNQDIDMEMSTVEGALEPGMENCMDESKEKLEVTAIQLASSIGGGEEDRDSAVLQKMSRAEERRREIERKRAEKRELERRKREEEERKLKLQEEIENLSRLSDSPEHKEDSSALATSTGNHDVLAAHGVVTVNQKSLRANLEEMRLKQTRLLLSYRGEGLENGLSEDIDSAQEAIEQAKGATEIEARRQRQQKEAEEERLRREAEQSKRTEAQTAATTKIARAPTTTATNTKSNQQMLHHKDCKHSMRSDLPSERTHHHTFTGKYMFSYFRYVPLQKSKVDNNKKQKGKRNRRPKGIRSK